MKQITYDELIIKPNLIKRSIATVLDYSIVVGLSYLYLIAFGDEEPDGQRVVYGTVVLPIFLLWFVYFILIEAKDSGTLMYQVFKIKVITTRRNKIGFTEAFKRHLLDPIDIMIYGIPALIFIKYTSNHQRLGDLFAGTIVVDTSDSEQYNKMERKGI